MQGLNILNLDLNHLVNSLNSLLGSMPGEAASSGGSLPAGLGLEKELESKTFCTRILKDQGCFFLYRCKYSFIFFP